MPWTIRGFFDRGDISVTVPFVSVTGDCSVTLLNGMPNKTGGTCPSKAVSLLGGRVVRSFTLSGVVNNQGLGDVIAQSRFYLTDEGRYVPLLAVTGRIKFPTANAGIGLGTGQFDEGFGLEASKEVFQNVLVFLDGGYTFTGKPDGISLRNQWNYDAGVGYSVTEGLLLSVYYEEWRAIISGQPNPKDVLFGLNYRTASAIRVSGSVAIGLSDGAPDYALTLGLSLRF